MDCYTECQIIYNYAWTVYICHHYSTTKSIVRSMGSSLLVINCHLLYIPCIHLFGTNSLLCQSACIFVKMHMENSNRSCHRVYNSSWFAPSSASRYMHKQVHLKSRLQLCQLQILSCQNVLISHPALVILKMII